MNNINKQLNTLQEIFNALDRLELKGYEQCGTYYKCMCGLNEVFNDLTEHNNEILELQKKEEMERQKKKKAFVKDDVENLEVLEDGTGDI